MAASSEVFERRGKLPTARANDLDAKTLLSSGDRAFKNKEFDAAIREYIKAYRLEPQNTALMYGLASTYEKLGSTKYHRHLMCWLVLAGLHGHEEASHRARFLTVGRSTIPELAEQILNDKDYHKMLPYQQLSHFVRAEAYLASTTPAVEPGTLGELLSGAIKFRHDGLIECLMRKDGPSGDSIAIANDNIAKAKALHQAVVQRKEDAPELADALEKLKTFILNEPYRPFTESMDAFKNSYGDVHNTLKRCKDPEVTLLLFGRHPSMLHPSTTFFSKQSSDSSASSSHSSSYQITPGQ